MLILALIGQLALRASGDSTYASEALRAMVERASAANRAPPAPLAAYRAHVESELSLLLRDTLGREQTAQAEQIATEATWRRAGTYELHVVGYRSQSVGVPYSSLSLASGWTVPMLYGERLSLGLHFRDRRHGPARQSEEIIAVHPFASDRDRYYRFSGGDTVSVLRMPGRDISIARILVKPRPRVDANTVVFEGEIEVDAERGDIVRIRGRFVAPDLTRRRGELISRLPGVHAVAYGEFVNAEIGGRYWLPAFQRTELQASFALLGAARSIFRVVSRFSDYAIDTTAMPADTESLPPTRLRVTYAAWDSLDRFTSWRSEVGTATAAVNADDFAEFAPDVWRSDGIPRVDFTPATTDRILRFNRIEGLYSGAAAALDFRSAAPGLKIGGYAGWAWAERTIRGGANATLQRSAWSFSLRGERILASTNDFRGALQDGGGVAALLGSVDDQDYVDRRELAAAATRVIGSIDRAITTVQVGAGADRAEEARLTHGIFIGGPGFRPNRGAADGRYAFASADVELHPKVNGDFITPGIGMRLHYELARGELAWERAEVGVGARRYWGSVSLSAHADAGVLLSGAPPPQQLFELGGNEALPGYSYKEFAGDRAALFRTFASYRFPLWRRPLHLVRFIFLPGLAPGVAVGAQGGWTELSSAAATHAVDLLGDGWSPTPVSQATGRMRVTAGGGVTFFSDVVHIGLARPLDQAAPWRLVWGIGAGF